MPRAIFSLGRNALRVSRVPGKSANGRLSFPRRVTPPWRAESVRSVKANKPRNLPSVSCKKKVTKNGLALEPDTVLFAGYVLVFSTLSEVQFEPQTILDWYRLRWQIELVFKRFKQIAQLGHLPKNDPQSARAWLYGKLFVALLVEKLLAHANSVSPWGYPLPIQRSP